MNQNQDKQPSCDNQDVSCRDEVLAGLFSIFSQADAAEKEKKEPTND